MTATTLKPRPVRKQRNNSVKKTMTEQQQPQSTTTFDVSSIVKDSHLPDIQVLDRNALWQDFQNRMKINNHEVKEAFKELKQLAKWTNTNTRKLVDRVKSVEIE